MFRLHTCLLKWLFTVSVALLSQGLYAESVHVDNQKWVLEATSQNTVLTVRGDTLELYSPEGATLWMSDRLQGDTVIVSYEAQVVVRDSCDRLSDLNCFFMASEPDGASPLDKIDERRGEFSKCYGMQLYYVGYGGNWNTTTRMRRYTGEGVPAVSGEYLDSAHLLRPNHWYSIRVCLMGSQFFYEIDGERIFTYNDSSPLHSGYFGFRTTKSHTMLRNFSVEVE